MSWRERLAFLVLNARLAYRLRPSKHDDERREFVKYPSEDHDYECHQMKNGIFSHFSGTTDDAAEGHFGKMTGENGWSHFQDELAVEEADVAGDPRDKITEWQAGWNVTNAIQNVCFGMRDEVRGSTSLQGGSCEGGSGSRNPLDLYMEGMFIVSFPYTVLQGGYWAVAAMVVVAYICCHTGNILVDCLYDLDPMGHKVRVRSSYVEIAAAVWGPRYGARIVNCAQLVELLMTCILYVLLCGDLVQGSFPDTPLSLTSWILLCTTPLLACAFLTSLRRVSTLSMWCTISHMLINAIILIYCFSKAKEWRWKDVQVRIDIWTFPISLGIIVFSYTSQIFLPALEGKLRDRSRFRCMMTWTHVIAAIFKALFSYVGFLTWGFDTLEVVTNNLPSTSLKHIVNFILVSKAMLSYPLPFFASVELLQTAFCQGKPKTCFPACFDESRHLTWWGLTLRLGLVLFTCAMAITVPHFALLMGLIGSFTGTMLSFVWPCYFHLRLRWYFMSRLTRILDIAIIISGLMCCGIGIYYSGHALSRAFQGLPPSSTHTLKLPIHD